MSDTITIDELPLKEAVRLGLVKYSTGLKYIHEGTLAARKCGREWYVDRASLEGLTADPDLLTKVDPNVDELVEDLSDPVREWAREQAESAPPMSAKDARLVAAIFRRTAKAGAAG